MRPLSTLRLTLLRACYAVFIVPWHHVAAVMLSRAEPFRATAAGPGSAS